jgi:hypothetical protein
VRPEEVQEIDHFLCLFRFVSFCFCCRFFVLWEPFLTQATSLRFVASHLRMWKEVACRRMASQSHQKSEAKANTWLRIEKVRPRCSRGNESRA